MTDQPAPPSPVVAIATSLVEKPRSALRAFLRSGASGGLVLRRRPSPR